MTLGASSGSWTDAQLTVGLEVSNDYGTAIPYSPSSMPRSVSVGWNQIEIYFSIVQRKVMTPNDFPGLNTLAERLLDFQYYWENTALRMEVHPSRLGAVSRET